MVGLLTDAASIVLAARLFNWIGDRVKGDAQNQVG
jgi:hypothetical protein